MSQRWDLDLGHLNDFIVYSPKVAVTGCQKWQMKADKRLVALYPVKRTLRTLHRVLTKVVRKSVRYLERKKRGKGISRLEEAETWGEVARGNNNSHKHVFQDPEAWSIIVRVIISLSVVLCLHEK